MTDELNNFITVNLLNRFYVRKIDLFVNYPVSTKGTCDVLKTSGQETCRTRLRFVRVQSSPAVHVTRGFG